MSVGRSKLNSRAAVALSVLALYFGAQFPLESLLGAQEPKEVDICELVAHPKDFNNKRVHVRATVEGVPIEHGTWLVGDSCRLNGVLLSAPNSVREGAEYLALRDAIFHQADTNNLGKKIRATFTGTFTSHSKRPRAVLALEKLENVTIGPD